MHLTLYADGGSRGNPGPAAAGAVLVDGAGAIIARLKSYLGETTNNQAEYAALILGLERALALGATDVTIRMDSKLVIEQISGRYKIKHPAMKPLAARVFALLGRLSCWRAEHVYREVNTDADALVNAVLDARGHAKHMF